MGPAPDHGGGQVSNLPLIGARALRRTAVDVDGERAQGVVEFAILVTILALLFMGTLDFARFMYYDTAIVSAARVGAETASNHCPFPSTNCARDATPVSDTLVMWSTYCEAQPALVLRPTFTSCRAGSVAPAWTPSCTSGNACSSGVGDIQVSPSPRTTGSDVTVTVGYSFKPYTLFIAPFFPERHCWTGDNASHTICASSTGRVS